MRWKIGLPLLLLACAGAPQSPRAQLLDDAVGAGVQIYPQVLAHVLVSEGHDVGAPKPAPVYLSRALCRAGKAARSLRLGDALQEVLSDTAHQLGREAHWVDSPKLFEQPEAADSGDILVCFGSIELAGAGTRVEAWVGSRDGTLEPVAFLFRSEAAAGCSPTRRRRDRGGGASGARGQRPQQHGAVDTARLDAIRITIVVVIAPSPRSGLRISS